jgi:hypothetical protein
LNALFERHREIESAQRIVVDCGDQCIKRQTKDIVRKVVDEVEKVSHHIQTNQQIHSPIKNHLFKIFYFLQEIIKMLEEKIGAQEM